MWRKSNIIAFNLSFRKTPFLFLVLSVLICMPQIVLAEKTITLVNVESAEVTINQNTTISVQGTGTCNFSLDFGDGSTVTVSNNFNKGSYQTSHSWNSTGTKTVEAKGLGPCTGTAQDTVIVSSGTTTTPSSGKKLRRVPQQNIGGKTKYELKPSSTPKLVVKPKIESALTVPCCALNPGTKLYLKGSFGSQPGKILMCGDFPGTCVELEKITWESPSKVNGVVPLSMEGRPNQSVEIKILAAAPPEDNYSNIWKMSFIGKPYCGKHDNQHIIYTIDGKIGRNCSPYACIEDQVGVDCLESCYSTGDCAYSYRCNAYHRCVPN